MMSNIFNSLRPKLKASNHFEVTHHDLVKIKCAFQHGRQKVR